MMEYIHPWCGKKFEIEREFWDIAARSQECCRGCQINHSCVEIEKQWMGEH